MLKVKVQLADYYGFMANVAARERLGNNLTPSRPGLEMIEKEWHDVRHIGHRTIF